ncbi:MULTISPECIES: class I SAM-dependent methyltransferase [Halococcus]|uniref:Type 11 methyltransferase n=1 Tax=Halococcus salifodinae DSM 8989 TaxID=1227456 RepID=M0MXQ5_9EURY|nr:MULTISPECIES: class I SAM-dependent methyltransferase [Halococcus]EMA49215.1 type 11 methyltransferase [Halococcus salifodinae DSM 8989]
MDDDSPTRRGVRETYDRIGSHFAQTRAHPWPAVERFVERATPATDATWGLDLGCGNARHAALLTDRTERVVGIDASRTVLDTARERVQEVDGKIELCQADATHLPLASNSVALAVYIATIHHLPTRDARIASLDELSHVLAPGGRALVSAWSTTHETFDREEGFDTTVDWTLPGGETVPRYYHIYDPDEFERDLRTSALGIERTFEEAGNCYAVVGD